MKLAYARPAFDEVYVVNKNDARRIVHGLDPDLELLSFQTMHGPKMSRQIPYLATFAWSYIRILSVPPKFVSDDLRHQFRTQVLPHIVSAVKLMRANTVRWPQVVVVIDGGIFQVACSEGWLFPSAGEIMSRIRRSPHPICQFCLPGVSAGVPE
ncbi:MAG: hypothetical protein AB7G28_06980 [Pirellulales bacterium]